jgi:hypothetical protein
MGLRPYSVSVITRTRSGDYGLQGSEVTETVTITESGGYPPKVRFLSDKELALGDLASGSVEVGPITPSHSGGGTLLATLTGDSLENRQLYHFRITGPEFPDGQLFRLVNVKSDRALHYKLTISPVAAS